VFLDSSKTEREAGEIFTRFICFDVPSLSPGRILVSGHLANHIHHDSRQAIKKYVKANNKGLTVTSEAQFDAMFNKALKTGVEKDDFKQPKGIPPSPHNAERGLHLVYAAVPHPVALGSVTDVYRRRPIRTSQARKEGSKATCCQSHST
jgi:linker histone H1 and H5 family